MIDLSQVPEAEIRSEWQRRLQARRITRTGGRNGGRPCVPTACARCGVACESRREAAAHCKGEIRCKSCGRKLELGQHCTHIVMGCGQ